MPNSYRKQGASGGRVDYTTGKFTKKGPAFDLEAESKKERAKMGGNQPPVQPPPRTRTPKPTPTPARQPNPQPKPSLKFTHEMADELEKS